MTMGLWVRPDDLDTSGVPGGNTLPMEACEAASYILWALSGRKYSGTRLTTEIYEAPTPIEGAALPTPALVNGMVLNTDTDSVLQRIRLRGQPVVEIVSVLGPNDAEVDPELYRLMDRSVLLLDNTLLSSRLTVTYAYGIRPPAMGKVAARHLAQQFLNLWTGGKCDLPQRVTSVSRQGISMTILDSQDFLEQFRTGIYTVDLFLKSANPAKAHMRPKVFSTAKPRVYAPSRTHVLPAKNPTDLAASYSAGGGTLTVPLPDGIDPTSATFQAIVRSPARSVEREVEGTYDADTNTVSIRLPFQEAARVLTASERGTWDLYAQMGGSNSFIANGSFYLTK